ncbi:MAG: hypothetical protein AAGG11_17720 [Pseudomonadota bacterium]
MLLGHAALYPLRHGDLLPEPKTLQTLPAQSRLIWFTGALVLLCCALLVDRVDGVEERRQQYGENLARSLADLSVTPLLKQDRIELGLLANGSAGLPGVSGITVYGVDTQILAMTTPTPVGTTYVSPIATDGSVIGYVNLTLAPEFMSSNRLPLWLLILSLIAILPWIVPPLLRVRDESNRLLRRLQAPVPPLQTRAVAGEPAAADVPRRAPAYLMLANLLNQLSLTTAERQALVADAVALGREVVALYGGELQPLTGASIAVWFDDSDADSGFRAACAALVLTRVLRKASAHGVFRVALHYAADRSDAMESTYLSDTALLAAAAADGEVILSHAVTSRLKQPERLRTTPLTHPLGDDFATTLAECARLSYLAAGYEDVITEHCMRLLAQRDSAAS